MITLRCSTILAGGVMGFGKMICVLAGCKNHRTDGCFDSCFNDCSTVMILKVDNFKKCGFKSGQGQA
ncbi:hypothetical protein B0181_07070 [Moraxella caviae]|uniref:Uncharacterized protein n=1 Tax=Moraxella caviae TaxID=34060 RepID=A0A1T0A0X2_9GAMM|nr:hypothetical protein [Moraxella caviae]OOR89433.1 hypothetical protein B0181_07070 [Moraxella caviae]